MKQKTFLIVSEGLSFDEKIKKIANTSFKYFAKFTGKHLRHWCFPVNFANFLRTAFVKSTSERLYTKKIFIIP